jgi:hypothetical protein
LLILLFAKLKKMNQSLNDYYPFNPRDYDPTRKE